MLESVVRVGWLSMILASGCAALKGPPPPEPTPDPEPAPVAQSVTPAPVAPPPPVDAVYALDEAVRDVMSGGWTHIGTGPWHGNLRAKACAYRNDRVIVVNVFCTLKETKAFELQVFSPTRGRVRIYAEARSPVSGLTRRDYFTFNAEAEPPPRRSAGLPPLSLSMSFTELRAYNERRYQQFLPVCFGGTEVNSQRGGCVRGLEPRTAEWLARNRAFLEQPPEEWYRIVAELRAYAGLHGKPME